MVKKRGIGLKKYWEKVKRGEALPPQTPAISLSRTLELIKRIYEKPMFYDEIEKADRNRIITLRNHGIIKTFRFKGDVIIFFPHQSNEAYRRLFERFPDSEKEIILYAKPILLSQNNGLLDDLINRIEAERRLIWERNMYDPDLYESGIIDGLELAEKLIKEVWGLK